MNRTDVSRLSIKQARILKYLFLNGSWALRKEMEDATGRKHFSKALGAPTKFVRAGTLEFLKYVDRRDMKPPFEYKITDAGSQALSDYEASHGDVTFM